MSVDLLSVMVTCPIRGVLYAVCGFYVEGRSSLEALTGGVVTTDRTTGTVRVTMPAGTTQERMAEVYALALPDMPLSVLLEVACPS